MTAITLGSAGLQAGKGGIARLGRITAKAFASRGHDVQALSYLDSTNPRIPGVSAHASSGSRWDFVARLHHRALRSELLVFDAISMARARPRLPGLRRPYAVWMNGIEAWEGLWPGGRAVFEQAAIVLANSRFTLDRYESLHGPLFNAHVCWLSTEDDEAPPARPTDERPPTALIVGRVEQSQQYKGHYQLIHIWPDVCARIPGARLTIVGEGGDLENVRAAAARSPVSAQIDVLGFVPDQDMPAIWSRADVFTMPCRGGGFGFVYVEAMRYGLPVIASTHDAAGEVNLHGETGFNSDLADLPGLTDCFVRLFGDRESGAAHGRRRAGPMERAFQIFGVRRPPDRRARVPRACQGPCGVERHAENAAGLSLRVPLLFWKSITLQDWRLPSTRCHVNTCRSGYRALEERRVHQMR